MRQDQISTYKTSSFVKAYGVIFSSKTIELNNGGQITCLTNISQAI